MNDLSHASFFSGAGGLDLGLERAGWRTVSFSEVDPYACAVLAHRWPGVPNLGDIVRLAGDAGLRRIQLLGDRASEPYDADREHPDGLWSHATLWSGGFPCTDLSVAGKRAGLRNPDGSPTRSGLAFAFLELVERHRPPWVLMENVPGLLSSHSGRDLGTLLRVLGDIGYGWAYRVLDARWFGVPQRRRRVFILAHHVDGHPDHHGPAEVLAVGTRCGRHPASGPATGEDAAGDAGERVAPPVRAGGHGDPGIGRDNDHDRLIFNATAAFGDWEQDSVAGNLSARDYKSSNHLVAGPQIDAHRMRAAPGLAGWAHDRAVAATLNSGGNDGGFRTEPGEHLVYVKGKRAQSVEFDVGDTRATVLRIGGEVGDDDLLPLGLDSHRYRVIGNGVAAPVATWIGQRLAAYIEARAA